MLIFRFESFNKPPTNSNEYLNSFSSPSHPLNLYTNSLIFFQSDCHPKALRSYPSQLTFSPSLPHPFYHPNPSLPYPFHVLTPLIPTIPSFSSPRSYPQHPCWTSHLTADFDRSVHNSLAASEQILIFLT